MKCSKCQHENREGARFCEECGTKLQLVCPNCGSELRPQAKFCDECGTRLVEAAPAAPPELEDMQKQLQDRIPQSLADKLFAGAKQMQGEYRLVTAVFADISGSSAMAREMPLEQYVQRMNDCFKMMVDTISIKYEGSINRFIGDCVLAFFGAPIIHENDAERAILAALDIRDGVRELNLNVSIGINTGMTYVGEMGSDLTYSEQSAWGPDVDFAKRLQEAAQPGEIYTGASTYRLTNRAFDFSKSVHIEVKGMEERQIAYPVLQVKERPEKLRGIEGLRARMIGREHEFADLKHTADAWLEGQGQIVSIIGEAGIGKSRLAAELRQYLDMRHETRDFRQEDDDTTSLKSQVSGLKSVLEGRCISIGQSISYWPFLDILRAYFGLAEDDDEATRAHKVKVSINQLMPQAADETLPLLGNLLSIKFGDELDDRLKSAIPEQIRYQTLMRLRDMFASLARKQPLMLILEDLHWADDLSLDLISLLMDELANTPLMLLCVYRPEKEHRVWQLSDQAWRKCVDRYTELRLNPLSTIESRQLVESLLEIENLPEDVKEVILTRSEGNPFFIEEVIRSLIEQDMIYYEDDRWMARDEIAHISVPDTIQSVVLARIDRLQAEARYALQCASVIGRLFRYRLLQHISRQEQDLERYISEFEEKELVFPERTVPELEYAFKHAFTRDVAYSSLLQERRKALHRLIGAAVEELYTDRLPEQYEVLAHHYSEGEDWSKALDYLVKSAKKAMAAYAIQDAQSYFDLALQVCERLNNVPAETLMAIYTGKAQASFATRDMPEMLDSYSRLREVAQAAGDRAVEGLALVGIARSRYRLGEFDLAAAIAQEALAIADAEDDDNIRAGGLYVLGSVDIKLGDLCTGEDKAREAVRLSRETGQPWYELAGLFHLSRNHSWRGSYEQAQRFGEEAVEICERHGLPEPRAWMIKGYALAGRGHYSDAMAVFWEGITRCKSYQGVFWNSLGWIYGELCDWERAIECNLKGVGGINAQINLADCAYGMGKCKQARRELEELYASLPQRPHGCTKWRYSQRLMHSLGEIVLAEGDAERALALADECLALAEPTESRKNIIKGRRLRGQVFLAQDKLAEAEQEITTALDIAKQIGNPPQLWKTYVALGDLRQAQGRPDDAHQQYCNAIAVIEDVAAGLDDESLRDTFMNSSHVQEIRQKAHGVR